jgi:hypothetical protein
MDILQELALILDAGIQPHPDGLSTCHQCRTLAAMRHQAIELHHLNHLPINTILGDPDGIAVAGESQLATLWHDMLNRTQRRRTD